MICRKHVWSMNTRCCLTCGVPYEIALFVDKYVFWLLKHSQSETEGDAKHG